MSKVLTAADLVIGKKYVPKSKSVGMSFEAWKILANYKNGPLEYIYKVLNGPHTFRTTLGELGRFLPSDMEEYEEAANPLAFLTPSYSIFMAGGNTESEKAFYEMGYKEGIKAASLTSAPASEVDWIGSIKENIEELEKYEGRLLKCGQITKNGSVWLRFEKNSYWLQIVKQSTPTLDQKMT